MSTMLHPAFSYLADTPRTQRGTLRRPPGRLTGWSIPIKDTTDVAGMPTTDGNPARSRTAQRDDPVVRELLQAGAAIPGKTLTSELGATCYAERPGVAVLQSPAFPGCTPGGSSSGAGVAVGLGLARVAHGTDAGGSIRVPAAACGVVGFKAASPTIAAHGFLSRNVADQLTVLGWEPPAPRRLRIGVLTRGLFVDSDASPDRGAQVEALAHGLGRSHDVVELAPYPESHETFAHFTSLITRAFTDVDPLDNGYIAWCKEQGLKVPDAALAAALEHRRALPAILAKRWGVDVLLCPTLAFDPPPLGFFPSLTPEESFYQQTVWSPWCSVFNMTGAPAIALGPIHLGALTIGGPELLGLAAEAEQVLADAS